MNIKAFFVDALSSALDLGIGTPDDVLRHVTPDVLAAHLPRPLWARLLTACLGAPRVDARLVVETIGIPNLCEHVPAAIIWCCIQEIGQRTIGKVPDVAVPPAPLARTASGRSVLAPPPDINERPAPQQAATPVAIGPSIPAPTATPSADQPLQDLITELEQADDRPLANLRPRSPTAQRFRQSNTGVGRGLGTATRRPQAAAAPAPATTLRPPGRRLATEPEPEPESESEPAIESADWRSKEIQVDDSQLVDWQTDGAATPIGASAITDDDFSDLGRKR